MLFRSSVATHANGGHRPQAVVVHDVEIMGVGFAEQRHHGTEQALLDERQRNWLTATMNKEAAGRAAKQHVPLWKLFSQPHVWGMALVCACAALAAPSDSRAMDTAASALRAIRFSSDVIPCGTGDFMVRTLRQADVVPLRSFVKLCCRLRRQTVAV